MRTTRCKLMIAVLVGSCSLLFCAGVSATPITYNIHVNTSTLAGTSGFLDFQLNPGFTAPVDFATATFFNFTTDGGPFSTLPPDLGDVSGSLSSLPLVLDNGGPGADHAENFTFGTFFDVFVTLDVPSVSPNAGSGSTLALDVKDSNFNSALSTDLLLLITTDASGAQTVINNNADLAEASAVPEPISLLLFGSGLGGIWLRRRRGA